jgi:oligosaccharyltransferase complex subunit epsilon
MEVLRDTAQALYSNYQKSTSNRTKLIDLFIIFNLALAAIQYFYMKIAGNFPYNAFLAGFFCTLGTATLSSCLRMTIETKKANTSEEKAFIEYMALCLLLYLVVLNYLG